jgi:hypothetical protein
LKGIFLLSRKGAETLRGGQTQRINPLAALRPACGRQALREPCFFWEMNEAHLAKNQIEKWFKKYTFN